MIKRDWKNPVLFLCGKLDLLADWRKNWQAEKSAENLASGKSGKLDAENLRKISAVWKIWKICGSCTAAENLRKNPLTGKSAENLENLKM